MPRNFVLASLAVLLVQGNAQEEEGSEVSCLMQSRTPQATTASRAMKSPALVDVPDPDLVTPRGGDDFSAYDKDGALEGHPMFGAEWSPKPKDQIMNPVSDLQDHIDPMIWEEHEKIQRWPVYKHGVSCDTSLVKQIYLAESRSDCNTMTLVGKYQFFMWTDASVDACYDDACREKSGFPMKKKKRNGKSFYYPKRCWMFDECKIVESEKASSQYDIGSSAEWDVYTDPEMYPVHAQEQLCGKVQLENVMGAKPIDTFFDTQVNSMGECQDAATRKGHQFFAVKHETFWRCSSLKSCDKEGSKDPGWMSYEKNEEPPLKKSDSQSMVFRPFKKMANKVCDCRKKNCKNEYVAFGSPEHCWRAPIRCYWNREKPCQVEASYWTQSPPQKFLQCITFETCDAKLRTQAPGWSVHRAAKALWPTSECKGLGGSVDKGIDLTGHAEALSICQDLAVKLGHKFFQLAGSICSSSNTCGQAVLKAIVHEQPRDSETHVSCESEQKIGNYLTSLMNERMPKPTKEHPGGIPASYTWRARAVIFRGLFHDAQDFNRLELQNRESGDFERMDPAEVGDYGGLDGCLYEPTQIGIKMRNFKFDGKYELRDDVGREWANFNVQRRALNIDPMRIDRSHLHASEVACTHFCCDSSSPLGEEEREGLCGASGCRLDAHVTYLDHCMVDMTTFLGNIIIKDAKGPEVVMSWGRRQADCRNMFSHKEIPQKYEPRRIGLHAAGLNFENAGHGVFQDFALMGFDEEGFAALMGAHSFGRLHKYSGDLVLRDTTRGFSTSPR